MEWYLFLYFTLNNFCIFLVADQTNSHKFGGLKQHNLSFHSPGIMKSVSLGQNQAVGKTTLTLESLGRIPCLFHLLVAAGIPWFVTTLLHFLPLWAHCLYLLCLCQLSLCISLIRIVVIAFIYLFI